VKRGEKQFDGMAREESVVGADQEPEQDLVHSGCPLVVIIPALVRMNLRVHNYPELRINEQNGFRDRRV
jgi:hypothetical protein